MTKSVKSIAAFGSLLCKSTGENLNQNLCPFQVVGNVYNRIGQVYYGFWQPPMRIDRRQGKPGTQHNKDLCQACKDGECTEFQL